LIFCLFIFYFRQDGIVALRVSLTEL